MLVAIVYAWLTWQLARAANLQAEASNRAALAAQDQARAAADQARTTHRIFEAGHRPYLEALLDNNSFWTNVDFFRLYVQVKNYGPVPADILRWQLVFRRGGEIVGGYGPEDELLSVFPNREQTLHARRGADAPEGNPLGPMEIEINIVYRGASEERYETDGQPVRSDRITPEPQTPGTITNVAKTRAIESLLSPPGPAMQ